MERNNPFKVILWMVISASTTWLPFKYYTVPALVEGEGPCACNCIIQSAYTKSKQCTCIFCKYASETSNVDVDLPHANLLLHHHVHSSNGQNMPEHAITVCLFRFGDTAHSHIEWC